MQSPRLGVEIQRHHSYRHNGDSHASQGKHIVQAVPEESTPVQTVGNRNHFPGGPLSTTTTPLVARFGQS
jgi:hypothetical protein